MIKNNTAFLYSAFVMELLLVFYFRNRLGYILSPVLLLCSGLFLSIYPYFLLKNKPESMLNKNIAKASSVKKHRLWAWALLGFLSLAYCIWSWFLFAKYPIDIHQSDIIPFINDVMVKRFLNGETVYAPISGFTTYVAFSTPNYLPFHWAPFILPALLHIDSRWVVVVIFILSATFYLYQTLHHFKSGKKIMLNTVLPFLVVFSIYLKQSMDAAHSVEIMIMGYYLFLASSLFVKNNMIKSAGMTLPLLSRYSFLFWVPVYFYNLFKNNLRRFFIIGLLLATLVIVLFILPFVLPIPEMLKTFNSVYVKGAVFEWQGQSWQAAGDRPFQLFQGTGFASWFYLYYDGTLEEKILAIKNVLMIGCIISALLPIVFYKKLIKVLSGDLLSLLALKLCLTIFYAFILVPYVYLFWVPLMVSVVIISRIGEKGFDQSADATI